MLTRPPSEKRADSHLQSPHQVVCRQEEMVCDVCSTDSELLMNQPKYLIFLMKLESDSSGFKSWLYPVPAE